MICEEISSIRSFSMQMAVTSAVPFLAETPINDAVSANFCSSTQCAANAAGDRRRGDRIGALDVCSWHLTDVVDPGVNVRSWR
jgi:hypothetical protein